MNTTNYTLTSIRERLAIQRFMLQQQDFMVTQMSSIHGYAKWDAVILSGHQEMLLEVKVRDWNHNSFSDWMIEEKKYNSLKLIQSKMNRQVTPYYVNVFNDGVALFNLNEIQPEFFIRESKKSVMAQDGKRIEKSVAMLPLSAATFYPFQVDLNALNNSSEKYFESICPGVKYEKIFKNNFK